VEPVSALDVASYILKVFSDRGQDISNLKLQKLVYYSQAWFLALNEKPLFDEPLEAWVHGPVAPSVFHRYKSFRWNPIPVASESVRQLGSEVSAHISEVIDVYGGFSATELERLTHGEAPWRDARGNLPADAPSHAVITCEAMQKFYAACLNG
jgi:uncharacterized phage-associated protein